jgi:hypothetical protein
MTRSATRSCRPRCSFETRRKLRTGSCSSRNQASWERRESRRPRGLRLGASGAGPRKSTGGRKGLPSLRDVVVFGAAVRKAEALS